MLKRLFNKVPSPPNFDITVYLRYQPILAKIGQNNLKVAEVGSGSYGIGPYLKRPFWGFDVNFAKKKSPFLRPVTSSATAIPKKFYQQFDAVLSVDMLEHLSLKDRPEAIKNMVNLTKKYLFLAFPSGLPASWGDRFLDWYYQKTHHEELGFLKEHRRYKLPKVEEIKKEVVSEVIKSKREIVSLKVINNTSILIYVMLLTLGFSQNKYLTRFYSLAFFAKDFLKFLNFLPYRKIIILEIGNE